MSTDQETTPKTRARLSQGGEIVVPVSEGEHVDETMEQKEEVEQQENIPQAPPSTLPTQISTQIMEELLKRNPQYFSNLNPSFLSNINPSPFSSQAPPSYSSPSSSSSSSSSQFSSITPQADALEDDPILNEVISLVSGASVSQVVNIFENNKVPGRKSRLHVVSTLVLAALGVRSNVTHVRATTGFTPEAGNFLNQHFAINGQFNFTLASVAGHCFIYVANREDTKLFKEYKELFKVAKNKLGGDSIWEARTFKGSAVRIRVLEETRNRLGDEPDDIDTNVLRELIGKAK